MSNAEQLIEQLIEAIILPRPLERIMQQYMGKASYHSDGLRVSFPDHLLTNAFVKDGAMYLRKFNVDRIGQSTSVILTHK